MPDVAYKPSEKQLPIYSGGTITPPKFMPTFVEWLRTKGQRIIKTKLSVGEIYSVPMGKVLFLTSAWVCSFESGANYNFAYLYLTDAGVDTILSAQAFPTGTGNNSITFSPPLGIIEGEKLNLARSHATGNVACGFVGFLVSNKNIPQI
tara:strand:- start:1861 stop:2307 length:447 start_codon:yes stop_codon:yes gene_type:complete